MLERFKEFIKNQALFTSDQSILLAVSGGVDSVVMANLFKRAGIRAGIAHCQFNLRGQESDGDEAFVRQLAEKLEYPIYVERYDTRGAAHQGGVSIQMAARKLRYDFFTDLMNEEGYAYVATAHHAGDVAETMLLNLSRGTGISGLHGILPKNDRIIRPMLFCNREEIEIYAKELGLTWREDSSNAETKYRRNAIRHKVIPVLKEHNPSLEERMLTSSEKLHGTERIMNHYIEMFRTQHLRSSGGNMHIPIQAVQASPAPVLVLYELIRHRGFTYEQARDAVQDNSGLAGRHFLTGKSTLHRDREEWVLTESRQVKTEVLKIEREQKAWTANGASYKAAVYPVQDYKIPMDPKVAALDLEKLNFPLEIRPWRQGDRFYPLGMQNQKKLSDFMIDQKIPLYLKDSVMVICSGEDIVWVAGMRIDHRYRITNKTRSVYQIGISEGNDQSI